MQNRSSQLNFIHILQEIILLFLYFEIFESSEKSKFKGESQNNANQGGQMRTKGRSECHQRYPITFSADNVISNGLSYGSDFLIL